MDVILNSRQALRDTEAYFVPEDMPIVPDVNIDNSDNDTSPTEANMSGSQHVNGQMGQQSSRDPGAETSSTDPSSMHRPQISRRSNRIYYETGTPRVAPSDQFVVDDQQSPQSLFTTSAWWSHFKQHMATGHNWIHLAGTMTSWFLLDVRSTALLSYCCKVFMAADGRIDIFLWTWNELPQSNTETLGWSAGG